MKPFRDLLVQKNRLMGQARIQDVRLPIDRSILSLGLERLLATQRFEVAEAQAARTLIRDGDRVLELGACLGFISTFIRLHTKAGRLVCVEANPALIPYIQAVHKLNGVTDAEVINAVVLPKPPSETVPFYCRAEVPTSSLSRDGFAPESHIAQVATMRLSDVLSVYQPSVLVMDIEGGELDVLSADSLEPVRTIILEIHPGIYGLQGAQFVLERICALGFGYEAAGSSGQVLSFSRVGG